MKHNTNIHIGQLICEELKRQERTVVWLARKINLSRSATYNILQSEHINTETLQKICNTLNHNFFTYYTDEWNNRHKDD